MSWKFDFWHLDLTTIFTLVFVPLFIYLLILIRKFLVTIGQYLVLGLLHGVSRFATQRIAAYLSLRQYCRLVLAGQTKFLNVPGLIETNLNIDEIFVPLVL